MSYLSRNILNCSLSNLNSFTGELLAGLELCELTVSTSSFVIVGLRADPGISILLALGLSIYDKSSSSSYCLTLFLGLILSLISFSSELLDDLTDSILIELLSEAI